MLFSEPKIPQIRVPLTLYGRAKGFSALQRAENSSNDFVIVVDVLPVPFQCSSASRKFLKRSGSPDRPFVVLFQCSSASRKFLKTAGTSFHCAQTTRFSALQRAENSSNTRVLANMYITEKFQCSSASRKFLKDAHNPLPYERDKVSVLFSEPKIPQSVRVRVGVRVGVRFSALQRAENSSKSSTSTQRVQSTAFQCSSASRKFLKCLDCAAGAHCADVSVLFSEPKIPQTMMMPRSYFAPFVSVLFSEPKIPQICLDCAAGAHCADVSVLFSEPKIPQTIQRS